VKKPHERSAQNSTFMRFFVFIAVCFSFGCFSACTIQSSLSNRYLTAEKLWSEKNYAAAASEFDRVTKESPNSALGLQALWRASTTRALFLNDDDDALKGFNTFLERAGSSDLAPQAQKEIGDIYFLKLNQYGKAIDHYQKLIDSKKFSADENALFQYRIARSQFLSNHLKKSADAYELLLSQYPNSRYGTRGKLDLAQNWYAIGDTDKLAYGKALKLFSDVATSERNNPEIRAEAIFGEAEVKEEIDQLEDAHELYQSILAVYPAPNVIKIRMFRLEERLKKKRK
jgi:tetratricopeptide (TPR) repeat protein